MACCTEVRLMLGAFEDGELEPHEMQEVARHLAVCASCERLLADYGAIGRALRGATAALSLDGFAEAVDVRIRKLRRPFRIRIERLWDRMGEQITRIGERMTTPAVLGPLAAIAAVVTILLVTPSTRHHLIRHTAPVDLTARLEVKPLQDVVPVNAAAQISAQKEQLVPPEAYVSASAQDSNAVISRLEAQMASVAVWSEPQNNTTVIWMTEDGR